MKRNVISMINRDNLIISKYNLLIFPIDGLNLKRDPQASLILIESVIALGSFRM